MNNLEQQIQELMLQNQPILAWELVKKTKSPLKDAVYAKVRHAFDKKEYQQYYRYENDEVPFPKQFTYACDRIVPRYSWLVGRLFQKLPQSLLDVGCGTGELGLTLGIIEIPSVGLNLNSLSIMRANRLAEDKDLKHFTQFLNIDFFDYRKKHDAIVMFDFLEHMPNPQKALRHAYSLLKKGGRLFLSSPRAGDHEGIKQNRWVAKPQSWNDGLCSGHLRLWTEEQLKELLKPYNVTEFTLDITKNILVEIQK